MALPSTIHFSKSTASTGERKSQLTNFDPDDIKRVKVHPVECPKCKADLMVKPSVKVCPDCGYSLKKPSPEVIEELRTLYRQREHYNRALDRVIAKLEQGEQVSLWVENERKHYAREIEKVLAQISDLLMKQKSYKKWFEGDGKGPLPDWVYKVTGGLPGPDQAE